MDERTLLDQTFRRWEMLLAAWNFYLVVAFALLALFAVLPRLRGGEGEGGEGGADRRAYRLFSVGFAFFAWTHLLGLLYMLKSWAALAAEMKDLVATRAGADALTRFENSGVIDAPEAVWVVPFHLIGDALVLGGLWWLCRPRPAGVQPPTAVLPGRNAA